MIGKKPLIMPVQKKILTNSGGANNIFLRRFKELNPESIVELACGHGRHVPHYMDTAGDITLVDVNQENLDFCRQRFAGNEKIHFYLTPGNNFQDLPNASYSAIFSYDSMIHFNLFDVASYINDAWRILKPGGKILFHHSNYYDAPVENFYFQNPNWHNFCSDRIFAHLATAAGFKVLSQDLLDASGGKNLGCLSLCQKDDEHFSTWQQAWKEKQDRDLARIREKTRQHL